MDEQADNSRREPNWLPIEARVEAVGGEQVPIMFANHAVARIDRDAGVVFLIFAQFPIPDLSGYRELEPSEEPVKLDIKAPVVSQLAMPVARFQEWLRNINANHEQWFGVPVEPVKGDE